MKNNLFEKAIFEDKLEEYAIGINEYFISDREHGGHWVLGSWKQHIIKLLNTDEKIKDDIIKMFICLIESNRITNSEKINLLLYHLHVYYYLSINNEIKITDFLDIIEDRIINEINKAKQEGLNDKIDYSVELIKKNGGLKKYSH